MKGRQGAERPPYSQPKALWETPRNPGTNSEEGLGDPKRARVTIFRSEGAVHGRQLCTSVPLMGTKPEHLGVEVRWILRLDLYRQPRALKLR